MPNDFYTVENMYVANNEWLDLIEHVMISKKRLNRVEATMILKHAYAMSTNQTKKSPEDIDIFLDVLYREEDDIEVFNQLPDYIERFNLSQCYKYTGINFLEWCDLPLPMGEMVLEVCGNLRNEENQLQAEMMKEQHESNLY
jgi:hypothetical protein